MDQQYLRSANRLGLLFVVLYLICFGWYFVMPASRELHQVLFSLGFLGYSGMNLLSFVFGAVQAYVWAYVFTAIWQAIKKYA